MLSAIISIEQMKEKIQNKKVLTLGNLFNIILIIITNIFIAPTVFHNINSLRKYNVFEIIILTLIEIIMSLIFFKAIKIADSKTKKELKKFIFNYAKAFPCMIIILVVLNSITIVSELKMKNDYSIIDNNKVIVYTTKDYYLTLDCEIINGNELKIHKGKQEKIDNNNIKTELRQFDKVEIMNPTKQ